MRDKSLARETGISGEANGWLKPVEGIITSRFGERLSPFTGSQELHNGTDIACETGTSALAIADGTVEETGESYANGKYLVYGVKGGYSVIYAHLSEILVSEGENVSRGQVVAKTGNTGLSTGPHLHMTIRENGVLVDPLLFFNY